jgi:hypothetical protein
MVAKTATPGPDWKIWKLQGRDLKVNIYRKHQNLAANISAT